MLIVHALTNKSDLQVRLKGGGGGKKRKIKALQSILEQQPQNIHSQALREQVSKEPLDREQSSGRSWKLQLYRFMITQNPSAVLPSNTSVTALVSRAVWAGERGFLWELDQINRTKCKPKLSTHTTEPRLQKQYSTIKCLKYTRMHEQMCSTPCGVVKHFPGLCGCTLFTHYTHTKHILYTHYTHIKGNIS